jgi:integrase
MRVPQLKHHRGVEQGYARFAGRLKYFGRWPRTHRQPPRAVRDAFERFLADWLDERARAAPDGHKGRPSVGVLWDLYHTWAQTYYRKGGRQTSEVAVIVSACKIAAALFFELPASRFGPKNLKAVQAEFVRLGWSRRSLNKQVGRVRGMFRWGVEEGYVPSSTYEALRAVRPLKKGRSPAPERAPVRAVPWADVELTIAKARQPLPDVVRVHWLVGCRAEDVVAMRGDEIRQVEGGRLFEPSTWKTEHVEGEERLAYWIGPEAWRIIDPRFRVAKGGPLFPTRSKRLQPGTSCYTTASYRRAITRLCERHGISRWTPGRLRHGRLTEIRAKFGVEAAQAVARHRQITTTQIYAEASSDLSRKVMEEIG